MTSAIQHVDANGIRFAYFEEGDGPLVLLLHGFPDTAHTWDAVRPRIAERGYRAVSPFMRGYHPTEVPTRDTDADTMADDVAALIEALGAKSAIVIGHDWGASAAYNAAARHPDRVEQLITLAIPHPAAVRPSLGLLWGVRHFFFYKLPGAAGRFAKNDFAALDEIYARWSPGWRPPPEELEPARACFSNRASLDAAFGYYRTLSPILPSYLKTKIVMPSVAFAGTDDPILSPAAYHGARHMFASDYAVEEVPGGHFLHREHPEVFAERLLAHL